MPNVSLDVGSTSVATAARSAFPGLLDAAEPQRIEANRAARETEHLAREVADHLRADERRVGGSELVERATGQQQRRNVGLPEIFGRHVHLRRFRRPGQRDLDVMTS